MARIGAKLDKYIKIELAYRIELWNLCGLMYFLTFMRFYVDSANKKHDLTVCWRTKKVTNLRWQFLFKMIVIHSSFNMKSNLSTCYGVIIIENFEPGRNILRSPGPA